MESAAARGVVGGPGGFLKILTSAVLAAFAATEGPMPCIATVPEGPEEAGCEIASSFASAEIVSEGPGGAAFKEVEVEG